MPLAAWLLSLVAPFAIRALVALGFVSVSFVGVSNLANQLIQLAQQNWSALPTVALQMASLSGIPQALGMIFGAYAARLAVWATINGTRYLLK